MRNRSLCLFLGIPATLLFLWSAIRSDVGAADEPQSKAGITLQGVAPGAEKEALVWTTAVEPKPLSPNVKKGLDWLVRNQLESGGWGQGEESPQMRSSGDALKDKPNVADTCIAALALIRSGSTPREGPYKDAIARAVGWVSAQVDESDPKALSVTSVQGTRVQQKLGPNIDTFLASMLFAEAKGRMPTAAGEARVNLALNKVLEKIKKHQKDDGSFEGQGWAPILAQAMCGKGINRARQVGATVPPIVLARAENSAKMAFATGASPAEATRGGGAIGGGREISGFSGGYGGSLRGSAGVELYDRAASIGVLQDSVNTNKTIVKDLREKARNGKDDKERKAAEQELGRIDEADKVNRDAQAALVGRLSDNQFVAGFGSNGGEEFLSYMNISESLVVKGGAEWKRWDAGMTENLNRVQNSDGSWTGHHCITGRTFCTSSALLVLLADRTPVPVQAKEDAKTQGRK